MEDQFDHTLELIKMSKLEKDSELIIKELGYVPIYLKHTKFVGLRKYYFKGSRKELANLKSNTSIDVETWIEMGCDLLTFDELTDVYGFGPLSDSYESYHDNDGMLDDHSY